MFDRPKTGERAVLVHLNTTTHASQSDLDEFVDLATSAGALVLEIMVATRRAPDAKYYLGSGKVTELKGLVTEQQVDLIIVNHALSPAQQRNLEMRLCARVLDRTGLILDIFAARARTHEGKLQVELAQCRYLSTRLVRGWTHLERQKGGIGLRGPGETQLETDRRLLRMRITNISKRLDKVRNQREQGRSLRQSSGIPVIALVGYTNAGKSTLFNVLTQSEVYVQDQLFATLDPTLRQSAIDLVGQVIFADTVGFIQALPHDLVDAFRATLEETRLADVLLHVVDASDDHYDDKIQEVRQVLRQIQADHVPEIIVMNKIDKIEGASVAPAWRYRQTHSTVYLSAREQTGLTELAQAIQHLLADSIVRTTLQLPVQFANLRAELYQLGVVQQESVDAVGAYHLTIAVAEKELASIFHRHHLNWQDFQQVNC